MESIWRFAFFPPQHLKRVSAMKPQMNTQKSTSLWRGRRKSPNWTDAGQPNKQRNKIDAEVTFMEREREKKKRSTEWQNRIYNLTFLPLDTLLFVENLLNNFCWQFYGLLQQNRHTWDFHPEIWLSVQWNVYFQTIIAKFAVQKRFFTGKTNVYVSSLVERGKKTTELRGINK